jgi:LacI family transcriptional regulator
MRKQRKIAVFYHYGRGNYRQMISGIRKHAALVGGLSIHQPPPESAKWRGFRLSEWVRQVNPDGAVAPCDCPVINWMLETGKPVIVHRGFVKMPPELPLIVGDGRVIGKMAAEYLLGLGLRNFGYFGIRGLVISRERRDGFVAALADAGCGGDVYEHGRFRGVTWQERDRNSLAAWLKGLPKPAGVMAMFDALGWVVLDVCRSVGLHVPDDVSVMGVDNDPIICETAEPPLSSVALNYEGPTRQVVRLLDRLMRKKAGMSGQRILVPASHVVPRQSTALVASGDEDIRRAVRFIEDHASGPIQVGDVAAAALTSTTKLQQKFRGLVGCSIHHKIVKARVRFICRMLLETDMSVSQIASAAGFSEIPNLTRFFQKNAGVTPTKFRRDHGK